ncbi:uncharacterized protein [Rutidosis leptorrhynchoides]|uniref:uncharacterized protein n=1 Tax=Rutidosis leptorrhynchoides TaxID=125765 RepID=UPI003A9A0894
MSENIPPDTGYKPRSALSDVTNQAGKRGLSFMPTSNQVLPVLKKQCVTVADGFTKQSFRKEICECVLLPHSSSGMKNLKEPCLEGVRENASTDSTGVKADDGAARDGSKAMGLSDVNGPRVIVDVEEDEPTGSVAVVENASKGKAESNLGVNDDEVDVSVDNLDSGKDDYIDGLRFPESQESRCGIEKCSGQKGDGFSSMCMDMIKDCSCSFCMKAAYLLSDLHYQDMKGRIAVIKKSQKEASILVRQNSGDGAFGKHGKGNLEKYSNLESDLTGRWKSLFLHMDDIFVREGVQLETNLSTLKELRDNYKTNSEKK